VHAVQFSPSFDKNFDIATAKRTDIPSDKPSAAPVVHTLRLTCLIDDNGDLAESLCNRTFLGIQESGILRMGDGGGLREKPSPVRRPEVGQNGRWLGPNGRTAFEDVRALESVGHRTYETTSKQAGRSFLQIGRRESFLPNIGGSQSLRFGSRSFLQIGLSQSEESKTKKKPPPGGPLRKGDSFLLTVELKSRTVVDR
jgi:hypothetical protein